MLEISQHSITSRKLLEKAQNYERDFTKTLINDLKILEKIFLNLIDKEVEKTNSSKEQIYNNLYEPYSNKLKNIQVEFNVLKENKFFKNSDTIQLQTTKVPLFIDIMNEKNNKNDFIKLLDNGFIKYTNINEEYLNNNLPNFDDNKDVLGNSTFSLIATTYLINISILLNLQMNDLLYNNKNYIKRDNKTINILIKPIYFSKKDFNNYNKIKQKVNNFSFIEADILENAQFLTVGKGYEYGGYQKQTINIDYRREDCSSWLCSLINMKRVSTNNIMDYRMKEITSVIEEIKKDEIKLGDIMCWRGHTGIIYEINKEDNKVGILSFSRDVPNIEGVGYKHFDISSKEKPRKFFKLKSKEI